MLLNRLVKHLILVTSKPSFGCVEYETIKKPKYKLIKQYIYKLFILIRSGQLKLERKLILKDTRILWPYMKCSGLGDAIMDLSGRALLKNKNIQIDLLTSPHFKKIFEEDDVFTNVFCDIADIKLDNYNAVLLFDFSFDEIKQKIRYFKYVPFACLFEFFDEYTLVNRTSFSYAAINSLFNLGLSQNEILDVAKPYLNAHSATTDSILGLLPNENFLVLGVGGIDPFRTYNYWSEFLSLLDQSETLNSPKKIILIGSENGLAMNNIIISKKFNYIQIISMVNKLTILQAREVIANADVFLGCDGGLLHVAHSTSTPSISLFSQTIKSYLRLTKQCHSIPIESIGHEGVNSISPNNILDKLHQLLLFEQSASDTAKRMV